MRQNLGTIDRFIRILTGLFLMTIALTGPHAPWGWIGLAPFLTGMLAYCPIYAATGLNTCSIRDRARQNANINNMFRSHINQKAR